MYLVIAGIGGVVARFFYVPQIQEMKREIASIKREHESRQRLRAAPQDDAFSAAAESPSVSGQSDPITVKRGETMRAAIERSLGFPNATEAHLAGVLVEFVGTVKDVDSDGYIHLVRQGGTEDVGVPEQHDNPSLRRGDRIRVVGVIRKLYRFGDGDMVSIVDARIERPSDGG